MDRDDRDYEMDHRVRDLDVVEVETIPGMSSVGPSIGSDESESKAVLVYDNEQPESGFGASNLNIFCITGYWLFRFAPLHNLPPAR